MNDPTDTHQPELGQALFSNTPFREIETSRHVTAGFDRLAEAIGTKRGDWERGWGSLTSNAGAEEYVDLVFAMRSYCWCEGSREGHEEECPPNFEHYASGLKASWYKHSHRSPSINRDPGRSGWQHIEDDCMKSLGITLADMDARRDSEIEKCDDCGKVRDDFSPADLERVGSSGRCVTCDRKSFALYCAHMDALSDDG